MKLRITRAQFTQHVGGRIEVELLAFVVGKFTHEDAAILSDGSIMELEGGENGGLRICSLCKKELQEEIEQLPKGEPL